MGNVRTPGARGIVRAIVTAAAITSGALAVPAALAQVPKDFNIISRCCRVAPTVSPAAMRWCA